MLHQLKNTIEAIRNYPPFMTIEQVSEFTGLTSDQIRNKVCEGSIQEYEKDSITYFRRSEILRLL